MSRRRATVVGGLLLTAALSTATLSPANAAVAKETVSTQTTKCRQWTVEGKKWLSAVRKPTKSDSWRIVRRRIVAERVHWQGPARVRADRIVHALDHYCH
ncbi:hypothetical protein GCM10023196_091370 [Actinoallomurus vinaceus]|uniref:Secreted protein n=1 Tax=Actinoallomurus vinaceus TaxID=1080074 RepID=A0ABP8UR46_9ACTN